MLLFVASLPLAPPLRRSGMRVGATPPGSFSDDSDGDARAWPRVASTSRRDASDDAADLRDMLDAAEAARAALREVASSAAAEREMAFEARDAATAECDRLRGELEPLRASLAKATRVAAQRDDETKSLRFKLEQLLRHARERDAGSRRARSRDAHESDSDDVTEERVYVEALATMSASAELELAETRAALRDARDEAAEVFSADAASRRERDDLRRERDDLRRDVERLREQLEREKASRAADQRAHDLEIANARAATSARARAADAEAELESRRKERNAAAAFSRERGGAAGGVFATIGTSDRSEGEPAPARAPLKTPTALALGALDEHRRSIRAHLEALQRDRETLARTKRVA